MAYFFVLYGLPCGPFLLANDSYPSVSGRFSRTSLTVEGEIPVNSDICLGVRLAYCRILSAISSSFSSGRPPPLCLSAVSFDIDTYLTYVRFKNQEGY